MAAEHLIQDWLDRCYIAIERARDVEKEERAQLWQDRPVIDAETVDEWIEEYYGGPLKEDEIVELPKARQNQEIVKKAYNKVWHHNARVMRKKERERNV